MKKLISFLTIILIVVASFSMTACSNSIENKAKPTIITTLFPQYDFVRAIAKDKANVKLLLKPGSDSHSYEPTASDMLEIAEAKLFIYTGDAMERWAKTILDSVESETLTVVDVSKNVEIAKISDVHQEGEKKADEQGHNHNVYDPHIWTNPQNAIIIVNDILNSLVSIDAKNEEFYKKNAEELIQSLTELDKDFELFFSSVENKKIVFGGKFSMYYFAKRYGLNCKAAYDTCSTEGEASPGKIAELIEEINSENIKAIYFAELENPSVAKTIAAETGAMPLMLHSCHNVTKDEFDRGETYISLMHQNLENLKKGMN